MLGGLQSNLLPLSSLERVGGSKRSGLLVKKWQGSHHVEALSSNSRCRLFKHSQRGLLQDIECWKIPVHGVSPSMSNLSKSRKTLFDYLVHLHCFVN